MIAPFNFKAFKNNILITNDLGRYDFLTIKQFEEFVNDELLPGSSLYDRLKDNFFLYDTSLEHYIELIKPELRYGKSYLFSATSLHIFVVTNYCNSKCVYCQAQSNSMNNCKMMSKEIAQASVDIALQSPQKELSFEFQGGEPLSNFAVIKYIIEYSEENKKDKIIHYSVVSNLSLLNDEMVLFFKENNVSISTSLDGDRLLHNINRPLSSGRNSYDLLQEKIEKMRINQISFGAILTVTKLSLTRPKEIIDEYLKLGLNSIFIRPLTPLGYALERWNEIGYSAEEFKGFYRDCIDYLMQVNSELQYLKEGHASIFLLKILHGYGINYMELRSPCGASVGQMAYYYDGNIFTCDEGRMLYEMGDASFQLGNVKIHDYNKLMNSKICKSVCKYSIIESIPKCCDCVYQPYCGACPVINYALEQDIISKSNETYRCKIYKGMLDVIFEFLMKRDNNDILRSWAE